MTRRVEWQEQQVLADPEPQPDAIVERGRIAVW
jgi:hypothetical protein